MFSNELLAGRRAFAADNFVATMHRVMHEHPQPLAELRAGLPQALVAVVDRALAKRAADRYATAAEMAAALDDAVLAPRSTLVGRGADRLDAPADDDGTVIRLESARPVEALDAGERRDGTHASLSRTSSSTLQAIERQLAHHVGPVARRFLQRAMLSATSPDDLCSRLSQMLPEGSDRTRFNEAIRDTLSRDPSFTDALVTDAPAANRLDEAAVARVLRGLTEVLGPIAPRLLVRMLEDAEDLDQLQTKCLHHISRPDERARFMRLVAN